MTTPKNPHIGGLFDDWLKAEGLHEEVTKRETRRLNPQGRRRSENESRAVRQ